MGLLLCGGRSTRMGADKARCELGGNALIEYPLRALRSVAPEVLLACGVEPRYAELGLPLVLDDLPDGGPLVGLAAGLEAGAQRGAEWVAVLACDMPRAEGSVLRALLEHARARGLDACLLDLERGSQPTFAVYHVRCAEAARRALAAGQRRLVSFHGMEVEGRQLRIEALAPARVDARAEVADNVNTLADLERQRRVLAAEGCA